MAAAGSGHGFAPLPVVRCAAGDDAVAVAEVHEAAWRAAYAGLIAAGLIDVHPFDRRVRLWRSRIDESGPGRATQLFVAEREGAVAGFAMLGPQRDRRLGDLGWRAELLSLYVHPQAQRRGLARLLFSAAAHRLLDLGQARLSLWVLMANDPARRAYRALGGRVIGSQAAPEGSPPGLGRIAYGWDDLTALL